MELEDGKAIWESTRYFKVLMECFLNNTRFVLSDTPTIADLAIAIAPALTFIKARLKFLEAVPEKVMDYLQAMLEAFPHTSEEFGMLKHMMCNACEHAGASEGL